MPQQSDTLIPIVKSVFAYHLKPVFQGSTLLYNLCCALEALCWCLLIVSTMLSFPKCQWLESHSVETFQVSIFHIVPNILSLYDSMALGHSVPLTELPWFVHSLLSMGHLGYSQVFVASRVPMTIRLWGGCICISWVAQNVKQLPNTYLMPVILVWYGVRIQVQLLKSGFLLRLKSSMYICLLSEKIDFVFIVCFLRQDFSVLELAVQIRLASLELRDQHASAQQGLD